MLCTVDIAMSGEISVHRAKTVRLAMRDVLNFFNVSALSCASAISDLIRTNDAPSDAKPAL
jgi:hypothetical protein